MTGRARKTYGHHRPLHECEILLKDHHESYIDWEEFERNQTQLAANAYGRKDGAKSGRVVAGLRLARRVAGVWSVRSAAECRLYGTIEPTRLSMRPW